MPRRKRRFVGINNKLIIDAIAASLIVQKAPALINRFFPLDPNVTNLAGVGAGYLTGVIMKNPQLANISLALGITGFLEPIVDSFIGGTLPAIAPNIPMGRSMIKGIPKYQKASTVDDFISLNDYIDDPGVRQSYMNYDNIY